MITKNAAVKIQNFVVNHESQPIKLNPAIDYTYTEIKHKW